GGEADGIITSHTYAATLKRAENQKFVNAFRAKYKKDPSYYAEGMYTAALWLDRGLKAAGSARDAMKLIDAVKKADLRDAPRGTPRPDEYNTRVETVYMRKVVKGAKGMENEVIGSIPNASQFWTFNPPEYPKGPAYSRDFPPCTGCQ